MHMEFDYQGKTYKSQESDEVSAKELVDSMKDEFSSMDRMNMLLADGSFMLIGKIALQTGVLRIIP